MNLNLLFSTFLVLFGCSVFSAQENYKTLVFKGNKQFDKENYESSSSKYMEAVQLNDKEFMAHYNLGNSLYKRKMYEEAKAEFEKAEKLSATLPDKSAALYNLGNTYMQTEDSKKAAELYKQALKQDPYNETIRKNYGIAMLKEKEKEQQKKQKDNSGGGGDGDQNKDKNKGQDKGNQPQKEAGTGQQNKGAGEGKDPNENKNSNSDKMPKDLQDALLNRVGNKERETAKKILNKNSYSMPESNEKDW
ncbi:MULTISPECIES: tetratricopeptide repeat protein [Chryseobacterium]|uniref:Photosystem I assembly protein Ycf3 n=1 Tax=Chryseobacterium salivictor TaxID=2547600 RepID=A0A4P6ZCS5_9FLAO|nr:MULTISPECIES: tetratricopeptide repeat protein [Chryseobacterium]MDQ0477532.1 Ca-activated chloride channel family protein [Chryseobacterium sp. MDT2-18]QBO57142.1 Photosystem I assembly protein Ycf3 [Chryseobacterium salivictor]